ncbi:hypothetical protein J132_07393 [Termitomyces sp. J132]|nr:hypothetical protein J132_07393 [Termitomyces sp. J132]
MLSLAVLALPLAVRAQTHSATFLPSDAPDHSEQGQAGTNRCGTAFNQTSSCQNAFSKSSFFSALFDRSPSFSRPPVNSITDWCIWAPPSPGPDAVIGNTERIEVAWCTKNGTGTRLIPDGAITGAHFVQTPDFVQVTGVGNLTFVNVPAGDQGGELDPHGQDGNGNPIGGLVFSSAFGQLEEIFEWTNFVSDSQFCFRACKPAPMAPTWCQHIYDTMGCNWNMPANYDAGVFEQCMGDSGQPMGVYGTSTFFQGEPSTPPAHPIPPSSECTPISTIANGIVAITTSASLTNSGLSTQASSTGGTATATQASTGASPTGTNAADAAIASRPAHVIRAVVLAVFISALQLL